MSDSKLQMGPMPRQMTVQSSIQVDVPTNNELWRAGARHCSNYAFLHTVDTFKLAIFCCMSSSTPVRKSH